MQNVDYSSVRPDGMTCVGSNVHSIFYPGHGSLQKNKFGRILTMASTCARDDMSISKSALCPRYALVVYYVSALTCTSCLRYVLMVNNVSAPEGGFKVVSCRWLGDIDESLTAEVEWSNFAHCL